MAFKNPTHRKQTYEREKHFFVIIFSILLLYALCVVVVFILRFSYPFISNLLIIIIRWLFCRSMIMTIYWFARCAWVFTFTTSTCACILSKVLQIFDDKMTRIAFASMEYHLCRQSNGINAFDAVCFYPPLFFFPPQMHTHIHSSFRMPYMSFFSAS